MKKLLLYLVVPAVLTVGLAWPAHADMGSRTFTSGQYGTPDFSATPLFSTGPGQPVDEPGYGSPMLAFGNDSGHGLLKHVPTIIPGNAKGRVTWTVTIPNANFTTASATAAYHFANSGRRKAAFVIGVDCSDNYRNQFADLSPMATSSGQQLNASCSSDSAQQGLHVVIEINAESFNSDTIDLDFQLDSLTVNWS